MSTEPTPRPGGTPGYETRDARVAPLVWSTVALFALLAGSMFAMQGLFGLLDRTGRESVSAHPMAPERQVPPEPRLQRVPAEELATLRARDEELLGTHAWIDRTGGVVRIPIERAMELVVERGLPVAREEARGVGAR